LKNEKKREKRGKSQSLKNDDEGRDDNVAHFSFPSWAMTEEKTRPNEPIFIVSPTHQANI
jgi:hypothetical protein